MNIYSFFASDITARAKWIIIAHYCGDKKIDLIVTFSESFDGVAIIE